MSEENKVIVRRWYNEGLNQRNLKLSYEIHDASYIDHDSANSSEVRGPEGVEQLVSAYFDAYPDLHYTIEDQFAEGDNVITRWTAQGTHQGELMGIAATGKSVTVTGISIDRFAGGKIVEGWSNWDALGMLQQMGIMSFPGEVGE